VSRRHARFEALLPPRVRSRGGCHPGRGNGCRAGALLGFIPLKACSNIALGSAPREGSRRAGKPAPHEPRRPSRPASFAGPGPRPWVLVPGSAGMRGRSNQACHRRTATLCKTRSRRARHRSPASPFRAKRFARAPISGGAPHLPRSLPVVPRRSTRAEPRRCCLEAMSVGSSLPVSFETSQLLWGSAPHRMAHEQETTTARA